MATAAIPTLALRNGVEMPVLGFGVFQIPPDETERAATDAIDAGFRSLDTARSIRSDLCRTGSATRPEWQGGGN